MENHHGMNIQIAFQAFEDPPKGLHRRRVQVPTPNFTGVLYHGPETSVGTKVVRSSEYEHFQVIGDVLVLAHLVSEARGCPHHGEQRVPAEEEGEDVIGFECDFHGGRIDSVH